MPSQSTEIKARPRHVKMARPSFEGSLMRSFLDFGSKNSMLHGFLD